jgi:hypothetical protein
MPKSIGNPATGTIVGNGKALVLNGLKGNDVIQGYGVKDGLDLFWSESLNGNAGNDTLSAGGGNDKVTGGAGNDTADGGAGIDTAIFTSSVDHMSFLWFGDTLEIVSAEGTDKLNNFEKLVFAGKVYDIDGAVARSDTGLGTENALSLDVLTNDSSFDGSTPGILNTNGDLAQLGETIATVQGKTASDSVNIVLLATGSVGLAPGETDFDYLAEGTSINRSFTYTIQNDAGETDTGNVSLTINGLNEGFMDHIFAWEVFYPDTQSATDGGIAVVSTGIELDTLFGEEGGTVDLTNDQIKIDFSSDGNFTPANFNGFRIGDYSGGLADIVEVSIDPATNMVGLDASRITFDAEHIWLNWQSLEHTSDTLVVLDVLFG